MIGLDLYSSSVGRLSHSQLMRVEVSSNESTSVEVPEVIVFINSEGTFSDCFYDERRDMIYS